jgi:hypothetical protein
MKWTFLTHEMAFTAAPLIHEMDSVTGGAKSLGVGRPPSLTEWGWRGGGVDAWKMLLNGQQLVH